MDDEWLGNGLRTLWLADDAFVRILIIVGVVLVVRWTMDQGKPKWLRTEETALDILKKRYAMGEIDKEQFKTVRRELM